MESLREFYYYRYPPTPTFTEDDLPDLSGKTYLVTGGAGGIGKELVYLLFAKNATVYATSRNADSFDKARVDLEGRCPDSKGSIRPLTLDLGEHETIKPAVNNFLQSITRLDGVWFNAGVMLQNAKVPQNSKGMELTWATNVTGHFLLQKLLLPLLVDSAKLLDKPLRVVWVSSDAHTSAPAPDGIDWDDYLGKINKKGAWPLYAQSKAANIILADETAKRYGEKNLLVVSAHPGHIHTDLVRHLPGVVVSIIMNVLVKGFPPSMGAITELYAGFSPEVTMERNGGFITAWGRFIPIRKDIEAGLRERGTGARLWELVEKEVEPFV